MLSNYFTLQALSSELHLHLKGAVIESAFTQRKNELLVSFKGLSAGYGRGDGASLSVSIEPGFNYAFLRDPVSRARKNSTDLFRGIIGWQVEAVSVHPCDRKILFSLGGGMTFVLQLYNTASSNIVLVDGSSRVAEAFKNGKSLKATFFGRDMVAGEGAPPGDGDGALAKLREGKGGNIFNSFKHAFPVYGPHLAREVLYRAGIEENAPVNDIDDASEKRLIKAMAVISVAANNPEPVIYHTEGGEPLFSIVRLGHLSGAEAEPFGSVAGGIKNLVIYRLNKKGFAGEKMKFSSRIEADLQKLRRTLKRIDQEPEGKPEELRRIGQLLMANIYVAKKGMKEIHLSEIEGGKPEIRIGLDPALTPVQNAERYFEKAKRTEKKYGETAGRSVQISGRIKALEKIEAALERCESIEDLKRFRQECKEELTSMKLIREKGADEKPPFRIFSVAGGFEVWVGKSSAGNDLLTMKYARPDDLWFHVRGAAGSHTVLRAKGNVGNVPKEAILQAAAVAAYYSKMRKAGDVPVAYCERKYVRKPKRAEPGAVSMDREKIVFVRPKLP